MEAAVKMLDLMAERDRAASAEALKSYWQCPLCTRKRKGKGLLDHVRAAHGMEAAEKMLALKEGAGSQ